MAKEGEDVKIIRLPISIEVELNMNISYVMLSTIINHEMEIARNLGKVMRICHYVVSM